MKKLSSLIMVIFVLFLVGCSLLSNTPTSKVEELLNKYQMLDNSIVINHFNLSDEFDLDLELQEQYQDLIRKQYRDLSYEIKDEKIDGDTAVVTVEIEVLDYKRAFEKYNNDNYNVEDYHKKVLKELEMVNDKVVYTIDFEVTMGEDDIWKVTPVDANQSRKLLGMYS